MTQENKNSSAGADESQNDSQEESDNSEENNQGGSLSSDEREELEELRQKKELKKNIELLDEEYTRKGKRNLKVVDNQEQEAGEFDEPNEMEKFLSNEREGALEDFISSHKDYNNPVKRDELLAEVKSFRDIDKAGYRSYAQLLNKAHRILSPNSSEKINRDKVKKINESAASSSNASGGRSEFSDNNDVLTQYEKEIVKKIPGMTEKKYIERKKRDQARK